MKKDLHAKDYRLVIFEDLNDGTRILTRSTVRTEETAKHEDGNEYPIVKVHISSSSHPFFTGQEKVLDLEGRVDRFKARAEAAKKAQEARLKSATKVRAKKPSKDEANESPASVTDISTAKKSKNTKSEAAKSETKKAA